MFLEDARSLGWFDVSRDGQYIAFEKEAEDHRIWVLENFLPILEAQYKSSQLRQPR